ncbi:MAG: ABC transporter permease [Micromonosporaceae bacterium]
MTDYPTDASGTTFGGDRQFGATSTSGISPASLEDVFDDPEHGEPGRDRMGVHAGVELLLLIAVGVLGFLLWSNHPAVFRGQELRSLLVLIAWLGLLTMGAGLSLRAAAPNLAVGPVAMAAAVLFAQDGGQGILPVVGVATLGAVALGVGVAVLVVGVHVPAWAASLAAAFVVVVWIQQHSGPITVSGGYDPTRHAFYLVGGFAALAALGGLFGSIKTVRRALGRFRPVADPAHRRGALAGGFAAAALIISMVLAAVGGVLVAANAPQVTPTTGLELSGLALGAALLGGTSVFGRRGGIFGSLLAVVLLALFLRYEQAETWRISWYAIAAALVAAGLVVTRLVEWLGRPRSARDGDDDDAEDTWLPSGGVQPQSGSDWSTTIHDSWSSSLPTQPGIGRSGDPWSDDRWGSRNAP